MRVIKFRIFEGGKMRSWEQLKDHYHQLLVGLMDEPSKNGDYILMQYTNLHDKNGKEIYEGDIIMPYGKQRVTQTYKKTSKKRVVKWVEPQGGRGLGRSGFNLSRGTYEVIGNIWEHPTLLPTNEPS